MRHSLHDGDLSSSGAVDSLQAGLPSNAKLERYPSRRPCPGSMPKPYPFWASVTPLWKKLVYDCKIFSLSSVAAALAAVAGAQGQGMGASSARRSRVQLEHGSTSGATSPAQLSFSLPRLSNSLPLTSSIHISNTNTLACLHTRTHACTRST